MEKLMFDMCWILVFEESLASLEEEKYNTFVETLKQTVRHVQEL